MGNEIIPVTNIAVFRNKKIRKIIHNNEWWFSVVDVCGVLTDSPDPGAYWRKLKQRLIEEGSEVVTVCHGLILLLNRWSEMKTICSNCTIFTLINIGYQTTTTISTTSKRYRF